MFKRGSKNFGKRRSPYIHTERPLSVVKKSLLSFNQETLKLLKLDSKAFGSFLFSFKIICFSFPLISFTWCH